MGVRFSSKHKQMMVSGIAIAAVMGILIPTAMGETAGTTTTTSSTRISVPPTKIDRDPLVRTTVMPKPTPRYGKKKTKAVLADKRATETVIDSNESAPVPTTTTTVAPVAAAIDVTQYSCPELFDLAMSVGWAPEQWPKLSRIIHRESRCDPRAWNQADPGTGSRGLTQINSFWCSVNKNNPTGFLQAAGVLTTCDDLFDPRVSLAASLVIWNRSGWSPWGG